MLMQLLIITLSLNVWNNEAYYIKNDQKINMGLKVLFGAIINYKSMNLFKLISFNNLKAFQWFCITFYGKSKQEQKWAFQRPYLKRDKH